MAARNLLVLDSTSNLPEKLPAGDYPQLNIPQMPPALTVDETSSVVVHKTDGGQQKATLAAIKAAIDGGGGGGGGGSNPPVRTVLGGLTLNSTTPLEKVVFDSTPAGGWNTDAGTCTLDFEVVVNNYFAVNPGGHVAIVTRCDTALLATAVSGQGVIFGNLVGVGGTEGAPFPRASQIETWEYPDNPSNRWIFPDTCGGIGAQMRDGGRYRFIVETTKAYGGNRFIRYRRYSWNATRACWDNELDTGNVLDHNAASDLTKTGLAFGYVLGSGAGGWSLVFSNIAVTWSEPTSATDTRALMQRSGGTFYGPVSYTKGTNQRADTGGADPVAWSKVLPMGDNEDAKHVVAPSKNSGQSAYFAINGWGASFGYVAMSCLPTHAVINTAAWGGAAVPELRMAYNDSVQLTFRAGGLFLGGRPKPLGNDATIFTRLLNPGGAQAKAFANSGVSSNFDIESLCQQGQIAAFLTGSFTSAQANALEVALRPLYCLLSTLIATTRDKGTA